MSLSMVKQEVKAGSPNGKCALSTAVALKLFLAKKGRETANNGDLTTRSKSHKIIQAVEQDLEACAGPSSSTQRSVRDMSRQMS